MAASRVAPNATILASSNRKRRHLRAREDVGVDLVPGPPGKTTLVSVPAWGEVVARILGVDGAFDGVTGARDPTTNVTELRPKDVDLFFDQVTPDHLGDRMLDLDGCSFHEV